MRLTTRQLHALKSKDTTVGTGVPSQNDGSDGDIRLQKTNAGVKLYGKMQGRWYVFSPDSDISVNENILSRDNSNAIDDNGFITLTGGFILQWGYFTSGVMTTKAVTFPMEFPNKCANVQLTGYDSTDSGGFSDDTGIYVLPTTTGFTASVESGLERIYWLAIGN